jgi:hypothetical protein
MSALQIKVVDKLKYFAKKPLQYQLQKQAQEKSV